MDFSNLFKPIKIGVMEVKNRFVVPPLSSMLNQPDGYLTERYIDYFSTRAKGGFGLLITEVCAVDPAGHSSLNQPAIYNDDFIPGFNKLAEEVHKYGAKIVMQLNHAGRQTTTQRTGYRPVAPSPIPSPVKKEIPFELTVKEIYEIIEKYGDAALRAKKAGFDAVEIQGAHSYLVAQFLSPVVNKRSDEFGGSLSGRMKFAIEIIKNVKKKVGQDFPVGFRISGDECVPGGRTLTETRIAAKMIEEAGADLIHVSTGTFQDTVISPAAIPLGHNVDAAAEIKKVVNIPVIAVGKIHDPYLAEDILETGKADLVAVGRQHLADPEFPNKIAEGRIDEIAPCIGCMKRCVYEVFYDEHDFGVSCVINPFAGRERLLKIKITEEPKKIVVIGAGPAGMEAAWVAAKKGHFVSVYEKRNFPGGQFRTASLAPLHQDIAKAIKYYMSMGKKYGVSYHFGVEATADLILDDSPDVVILATGGIPLVPDIEGINHPKAVKATDVIEGSVGLGDNVLVIGGDTVGVAVAESLSERGHKVTIIEKLPQIARDHYPKIKYLLLKRLKEYEVNILTNANVTSISDESVVYMKDGTEHKLQGIDSIVLATGSIAYNPLEQQLNNKVREVYVIGDAVKPRQAFEAIYEGAHLAVKI